MAIPNTTTESRAFMYGFFGSLAAGILILIYSKVYLSPADPNPDAIGAQDEVRVRGIGKRAS